MALQMIGAGFGRTGTASLKAALETLGYGRCYHMFEFMEHPEHARYWDAASKGRPVAWDELFEGYRATVDWPGCTFYRELMAAYPDAKVVLSVRDPERWFESASKTIFTAPRAAPDCYSSSSPRRACGARFGSCGASSATVPFAAESATRRTQSKSSTRTSGRSSAPYRPSCCSSTRSDRAGDRCASFWGAGPNGGVPTRQRRRHLSGEHAAALSPAGGQGDLDRTRTEFGEDVGG